MMGDAMMGDAITIAVSKGRILSQLTPILERANLDTSALTKKSRALVRTDRKGGIRYLLLKADDVPTYVEHGAAHLGIVGRDVLLERSHNLYVPVDLQIGRCHLMVAGRPGTVIDNHGGEAIRVATKFVRTATRHCQERGWPATILSVTGSVELAPITGLSDVIVDIVETGETLRQNGLVELETICQVSSVVVANPVEFKLRQDRIRPLLDALRASVLS